MYGQGSYQGVHEVDKSAWRLLPNCHNHLKVTCRLVGMTSDFVRYMLFMTCRGMHVLLSCTKPSSSPGMNCALSLYGDIELLPPWTIQYTWKYELPNGRTRGLISHRITWASNSHHYCPNYARTSKNVHSCFIFNKDFIVIFKTIFHPQMSRGLGCVENRARSTVIIILLKMDRRISKRDNILGVASVVKLYKMTK